MDGWTVAAVIISLVGLALDYARQRRLDEGTVQRQHDAERHLSDELQQQTRRIDTLFAEGNALAHRVGDLERVEKKRGEA